MIKKMLSLLFLTFVCLSWADQNSWKQELIDAGLKVRQKAYAPYSKYLVGAALLSVDGKIYTGANVENASYGLTICAERSAVFHAVCDGCQQFKAIAVITKDGGSPCGACRQVLNEFNPNIIILIANEKGVLLQETTLSHLLPDAFGPKNLEK